MWNPFKKRPERPAEEQPALNAQTPKPTAANSGNERFEAYKRKERERLANQAAKSPADEFRQLQFEQLGISYKDVLKAEAKKPKGVVITGITPQIIEQETAMLNAKLIDCGFKFQVSHAEYFICQMMYFEHQHKRQEAQRTGGKIPVPFLTIDIAILRETERLVRQKHGLTDNPAGHKELEAFRLEVKDLYEKAIKNSLAFQLHNEAVRRLKRERKQTGNEPILEKDVQAMIETIKSERSRAKPRPQ